MIRGGRGRGPESARLDRTDLDRSTADRTDRYDDLVEPQVVGAQMISLIDQINQLA